MSVNKPSFIPSDLDISEGTILGNSYKVEAILREGTFGFVTKCLHTKNNKAVAVKVNKNNPETLEKAKQELFILKQLRSLDPDRCNIVKWNSFFLDGERICIDFELLDQSLYDYMKERNFQGLPISELRPILYQLANALSHLSSVGIIHADLKPDNVMVVDRHQSPIKVKIIDFGLACPVSAVVPGDCVQTIWYRAPEVLLHAAFNQAIDMWSLGLIAAELVTGLPLYPGEMGFDVLKFIIETQGQPPDCVLDRGFVTDCYFIKQNYSNERWRFKSVEQFQSETGFQPQETRFFKLKSLDDLERIMKRKMGHHSGQDLLVSLIKQMLHLDSSQRITPLEVLQHPFFDSGLSQNSSRDICIDIENTEDQSLVPSQQPSHCQSQRRHSIDSSVQNPVELPQASPLSMSVDMPAVPSDFDISEGTILGNSYRVESILGEGAFGFVTKCLNTKNNRAVAVKVNKNDPEKLKQAKQELFILKELRSLDPDRCNIVQWNGFFLDRGRICIDVELLDQSLFDYKKERKKETLPIRELRPILYQLANALSHLSSVGIIHADLKPDNVMVVDRHQSPIKVKIIDFGLACPVSAVVPGDLVQTIWYRAPEVLLHAAFNQAIDMWSLGLIAAELATGMPLYPGKMEFDVLRFIIETQGQPPDCVLDCGLVTDRYFLKQNYSNQRWRFKSVEQFQHETGFQPQDTRYLKFGNLDQLEHLMAMRTGYHSGQDLLVSLIKQMLHLDSSQRITPLEVLQHPFFDSELSQNSSRESSFDIENTEVQSLFPSQLPSHCQSQSSIDSSVQSSFEFPQLSQFIMSVDMPAVPSDLDISVGTILGNSYRVESILGEGGFGFVTKCLNTKNNRAVAVKITKNDPEILEQAKEELFILKQLRSLDPDRCNIVKWNGFFLDGERICIDFELLDQSLYDYNKERILRGLLISELRPILYQLANALSHLSSVGIIHADLKPDNVMVVDRHQSPIKVKIIDFGLACPVSAVFPGDLVQTIWYRAPEVLLHAAFNQAIDMWSLGLIAAELVTGLPLYPGEMGFDVLKFIIETQGQPPDCVLDRGFVTDCYFLKQNYSNERWRFKSVEQFQSETGFQPQETRFFKLKSLDDLERIMKRKMGHHSGQDLLVSLIKQMLHLDSSQRITPLEVLQHPFFDSGLSQNSSRDICINMENTEDQSLVPSQQPSHCQSQRRHSIDSSIQKPVELPQASPLSMSVDMPAIPNDLNISEGAILGNSYRVEAFLGEGTFGFVTKCLNIKNNKAVAVKVNKNDPGKLTQAKQELIILKQLRSLDPDRCNIVKWNGFFLDRERIYIDFELLDQSLCDYTKDHKYKSLPIRELRPILYQLANALSHLSSEGIIHADLKPDNVMVVDRHQSPIKVKIIDFGLACPVSAVVPGDWVQTIWYRAPEVLLHAEFNQAIDMWSLGLIAAELATGWPLYPGKKEFDVLRFIIETQGQPPDCVLDRGFVTDRYFTRQNYSNQQWRFKSVEQFQSRTGFQPQDTRYFKPTSLDDLELAMKMRTGHQSGQDLLVSLIKQMLHLDSNQRITPLEVLKHLFFDSGLSQNS